MVRGWGVQYFHKDVSHAFLDRSYMEAVVQLAGQPSPPQLHCDKDITHAGLNVRATVNGTLTDIGVEYEVRAAFASGSDAHAFAHSLRGQVRPQGTPPGPGKALILSPAQWGVSRGEHVGSSLCVRQPKNDFGKIISAQHGRAQPDAAQLETVLCPLGKVADCDKSANWDYINKASLTLFTSEQEALDEMVAKKGKKTCVQVFLDFLKTKLDQEPQISIIIAEFYCAPAGGWWVPPAVASFLQQWCARNHNALVADEIMTAPHR